jgi:chromosomal replication initiator protein
MVDGVVDIPLPGRMLDFAAEQGDVIPPCHFLAGPENRLVEVAVRSVVEQQTTGYNPLVFYGPSGTGKSHLVRGLAAAWKPRERRQRVVCTTAVDFARELADAIETQDVDEFRAKHRNAAMLVVEDLGMLPTRKSGKLNAQEELIHTLDALIAENRWVMMTASAAPSALPGILPALQSRLSAGLMIPLAPPGIEARLAILEQLAAVRNIPLPTPVARVLAEGLIGTAPELAGSLLQLAMSADLETSELDVETARRFIANRGGARQPTLHEIALASARHFSLRLSDLRSPVRRRALVVARGVAVYLARRLTDESLDQIGGYFGGRDHSTIMHSCHKTEELLVSDPAVREAVDQIQKMLTVGAASRRSPAETKV